jgi:hypothetical protein
VRSSIGGDTVAADSIAASAVVAACGFHLDMTFSRDRFLRGSSSLEPATILSEIVASDTPCRI